MPDVYRAHDLLLFPSLHDSGGHVVLEALAHGLPVVCFDLGGPGSIVDESCGRVVTTGGRSRAEVLRRLTDALEELADAPQLRRRLSEGARSRVCRYDWRAADRPGLQRDRRLGGRLSCGADTPLRTDFGFAARSLAYHLNSGRTLGRL